MSLLLIARHGNNFEKGDIVTRVGARTDLPLSSGGRAQAARLGAYLKTHDLLPDAVFTSRLIRTQETARLALAAADHDAPIEARAMFDEIDYGPDENRPEPEVVARIGAPALAAWEQDGIVPPGWLADPVAIRQGWVAFAAEIARLPAGRIVLTVTSNGIARFAPAITGDEAGFRAAHKPKIGTGALCVFRHDGAAWRLEGWDIRP